MRNRRRLKIVGALSLLLTMCSVGVALAHEGWVFQGQDKAGTYEAHRHIDWCDEESDGNRVHAEYVLILASSWDVTADDPDGAGGSCGHEPNLSRDIRWHKVCEANSGCSADVLH